MYTLSRLKNSSIEAYERLTFPILRCLLQSVSEEESIVAITASEQDLPIGLALAVLLDDETADLLSIFVEPAYRCTGVGTALLMRLTDELSDRACTKINLTYTARKPTTPALERVLQKCEWVTPQPRMVVCKGKVEPMMAAPWAQRYGHLPAAYQIVDWQAITLEERQIISNQQAIQPWIPEDLVPFQHEKDLEPLNSLALRYQGQVVGWLVNHRLNPTTIRYTCSFVRKDLQRMGRIIPLYIEAAKRQIQVGVTNAIWTTPLVHQGMVNFIHHHWVPYLDELTETRFTLKSLISMD